MNRFVSLSVCGMLLVMGTAFAQETPHKSSGFFQGMDYTMPEGVDLTQEFVILNRLIEIGSQANMPSFTNVPGLKGKNLDIQPTLLDDSIARTLWNSRWNVELPSVSPKVPDDIEAHDAITTNPQWQEMIRSTPFLTSGSFATEENLLLRDAPHTKEYVHLKPRVCDRVLFISASTDHETNLYLIVLYTMDASKAPVYSYELNYVFMGKCAVSREKKLIYDVKPTGSIFTFLPGNQLSGYYNLEDGQILGSQMIWYPNGKWMTQAYVHQTGTLYDHFQLADFCKREDIANNDEYTKNTMLKTGYRYIRLSSDASFNSVFEVETQEIDPNELWIPLTFYHDAESSTLFPRKHRIAWSVETESASIVSDVVESATE